MNIRMATIRETAKAFGLAEYHVRRLVLTGEVVAIKSGNKYLVNVTKFEEYLNTSRITPEQSVEQSVGIQPINL